MGISHNAATTQRNQSIDNKIVVSSRRCVKLILSAHIIKQNFYEKGLVKSITNPLKSNVRKIFI